jgi:tryptophan synthase alpha chain
MTPQFSEGAPSMPPGAIDPLPAAASSGIGRIHAAFAAARRANRAALLPFITAGFPDLDTTEALLRQLPDVDADLIEVGIPFSDPIADGPVIAESMHRALIGGTTPDAVFAAIARVRPRVPVLAMVSVSIVSRMGCQRFVERAVDSGVAGLIVPDADPADARRISSLAAARGAGFCALVAPTTPVDRARELVSMSTGFVYLLARAGVTGERSDLPDLAPRVEQLRALGSKQVAVGFGVSTADHVREIGGYADGAIVGSAIVRRMADAAKANANPADAALALVRTLGGSRQ